MYPVWDIVHATPDIKYSGGQKMALFEIRNLTFTYPDQEKPALTDLNFSLKQGEFLVVCGKSGCGKSTLLRHFKTAMAPYGERKGQILFEGRELDTVSVREQGARIGYVLQSPDNQLVTDKVWHELAFGLENLGYETGTIRLRVAVFLLFHRFDFVSGLFHNFAPDKTVFIHLSQAHCVCSYHNIPFFKKKYS